MGIGKGAEPGILIRSGTAFQTVTQLGALVFDKTGTLTKGRPRVTDVVAAQGFDEDELVRVSAAVEQNSEHPLAGSLTDH